MKLLFVVHDLPPGSVGGSELATVALARTLSQRHDVYVFAGDRLSNRGYRLRRENSPHWVTYRVGIDAARPPTLRSAYNNPRIDEKFGEVVDAVRPDVIHIHGVWGLSNNLPIIGRSRGVAVVFTLHDFWLMCPRGQRLRPSDMSRCEEIDHDRCAKCLAPWAAPASLPSWSRIAALSHGERPPVAVILKKVYARARLLGTTVDPLSEVRAFHDKTRDVLDAVTLFLAPSRFLRDQFVAYGISSDKIVHSDNGIDVSRFAGCREKVPPSLVRFGFIGSWMPSKGLHILIEAFRGLSENARLTILGGPPAGDSGRYATDLLARVGDRRITIAGRFAPEQIASVLNEIDVLVVPSIWYENAPLTIKEAFAARTPVIASRCGGMAECVSHRVNGLLFNPGDVSDLRATMRELIRDVDLIPALSRGTPAVRTLEDQAAELEQLFYHQARHHGAIAVH
jgi:glycosyltransferase involved in cell wall biosynthesis